MGVEGGKGLELERVASQNRLQVELRFRSYGMDSIGVECPVRPEKIQPSAHGLFPRH